MRTPRLKGSIPKQYAHGEGGIRRRAGGGINNIQEGPRALGCSPENDLSVEWKHL